MYRIFAFRHFCAKFFIFSPSACEKNKQQEKKMAFGRALLIFAALALHATRGEQTSPILQSVVIDEEAAVRSAARAEAFWNPAPVVRTEVSFGEENDAKELRSRRATFAVMLVFSLFVVVIG